MSIFTAMIDSFMSNLDLFAYAGALIGAAVTIGLGRLFAYRPHNQ